MNDDERRGYRQGVREIAGFFDPIDGEALSDEEIQSALRGLRALRDAIKPEAAEDERIAPLEVPP